MKIRYIKLLECYHNNGLLTDELVELFDWLNSSEGKSEYEQYMLSQQFAIKDNIRAHVDAQALLREIRQKAGIRKSYAAGKLLELRKYAAVLLAALFTGSIVWLTMRNVDNSENFIFAVAKGNKGTLTLPDGSEIWLNEDSKITYNGQRNITLKGEAYMQVAEDKKRQFVVNTQFADIIVYGTTFNVIEHSADSALVISLLEGSLGIKIAGEDDIVIIVPGQVACFDARNGNIKLYENDFTNLALWRNEELLLANVNANELFEKMEAWYGINIELVAPSIKVHKYNMTIRNESITEMLELINRLTPITYKIQDKEIIIQYIN